MDAAVKVQMTLRHFQMCLSLNFSTTRATNCKIFAAYATVIVTPWENIHNLQNIQLYRVVPYCLTHAVKYHFK